MAWIRDDISFPQLARYFREFEDTHVEEIGEMNVEGHNIWPYLKGKMFFNFFFYDLVDGGGSGPDRGIGKKISLLLRLGLEIKNLLKRTKMPEVLFYVSSNDYVKLNDHTYTNLLIEPFIDTGMIRNYIIASGSEYQAGKKTKYPIQYHFPLYFYFYRKRLPSTGKCSLIEKKIYDTITTFFSAKNIDLSYSLQKLKQDLGIFIREYYFFQFWLKKLSPAFIITSEQIGTPFMAAAKKLHIKLLDLQHGMTIQHDPVYAYSDKINPYRHKLPLPDYLGLFGNYFKNSFYHGGFWQESSLFSLGSAKVQVVRSNTTHSPPSNIIFIPAQGAFFKEILEMLLGLGKLAGHRYEIILKPHPLDPPHFLEAYNSIAEKSDWLGIASRDENPYQMLNRACAIAGFHSTLLLEALACNKPVFTFSCSTLPYGNHTIFGMEHLKQIIPIVDSAAIKSIHTLFNKLVTDKNFYSEHIQQSGISISEEIFDPHYHNNVRHFIQNFVLKTCAV